MDARRMQAVGVCRFSYPAVGGFQVEHDSVEARCAFLYEPARLEARFAYFETITLPALKAQTDPDFTFLVVIGDTLPEHWRARLMDGLSGLPQAVVQAHPPGPHREVMKTAINSVLRPSDLPSLQFRMDDDDAVATGFVAALREAAEACAGPIRDNRHVAIDFTRGYVARPTAAGLLAQPVVEPLTTAALAITVRPNLHQTILSFAHHRLPRFMPVISDDAEEMFVRGHSDMNDSRQKADIRTYDLQPLTQAQEARFRDRFAIDSDAVRAAFSGP